MGVPLLPTKLASPPLPPAAALVTRSRLLDRLDAALPHAGNVFPRRLTLVSAPAGYGKTTLIVDWLSGGDASRGVSTTHGTPLHTVPMPPRFAWLSLDEEDNDPARFLAYLIAAVQTVAPDSGRIVQGLLQAPQRPPFSILLTMLIGDLVDLPDPFVLVLDDYHLIQAMDVHELMTFLTGHQPPQLHLVLITREDPPLSLARLRSQGQLTEIRQEALRFTPSEAETFLNQVMSLNLGGEDVRLLQTRIEGWIAGLQLAALALGDRADDADARALIASFSGSHHFVLDYLMEEVFSRQPFAVQDFLLKTAILNRLTPSLCDAVTGQKDSYRRLHALANANVFVQPLDGNREWYRYHHLFADLLLHRLRLSDLDETALRAAAGRWYVEHKLPREAIPHLLRAGDWARTTPLLEEISERMLRHGETGTLLRWLRQMPETALDGSPYLRLQLAWTLALSGQLDAADEELALLEAIPEPDPHLLSGIVTAQAHVARSRHDLSRTIALGKRALDVIPPEDDNARCVTALNLGIAYWNAGHLAEATTALTDASRWGALAKNHYAGLMANSFLALIKAVTGELRAAGEQCRHLLKMGDNHPATGMAHLALGSLALEANDFVDASAHLEQAVALAGIMGNGEMQSNAFQLLALARAAGGDHRGALEALDGAQQATRQADLPPHAHARIAACAVQLALAQGDLASAESWASQVTVSAEPSPFYKWLELTPARLALARGQMAAALAHLDTQVALAASATPSWRYGLLEIRLLQALAAPKATEALAFLDKALALAGTEPFAHSFLGKGEPMVHLLHQAASHGQHAGRVRSLLETAGAAAAEPRSGLLHESLSGRERELLALLACGLTNAEIALNLVVSVNTVKTHLRHIYEKLTVHNRRDAVKRARALGLIADT